MKTDTSTTAERPRRLLTARQVDDRAGIRKTHRYELIAKGLFPAPVRIGPRGVRWIESQVDDWIAARPTVGPATGGA